MPHALAWLEAGAGEPFFLLLHGYDPHCPYTPPEPWKDALASWYTGSLDPDSCDFNLALRTGAIGPQERRFLSDLYDAEVASADETLGAFLDALRARDLLDRSILVFTSDHGELLGNHDHVGHGLLSDETLHVPLLIRFPGGAWAGPRDDAIEHVDLVPTLLSALGVEAPAGLQGRDLMPRIRGEAAQLEPRLRISQIRGRYTLRDGDRWQAHFRLDGEIASKRQLHDLLADPGETRNLAETPEGRARFEDMLASFLAWRARTAAEDRLYGAEIRPPAGNVFWQAELQALGYVGETGAEGAEAEGVEADGEQ